MSMENLTQAQKQYLVLGVVVAAIALVLGWIGVRLSLASVARAKSELGELTDKIERADATLKRGKYTGTDFDDTVVVLKEHLAMAPPNKNYFSWATEEIYSIARNTRLEIDSIDEYGTMAMEKPATTEIQFDSYSIRISARGSYEDTKRFLEYVEQNHPLVRIAGLEISSGRNEETHDIQLLIQWPYRLESIVSVWDGVEEKREKLAVKGDRPRRPAVESKVAQAEPQQEAAPAEPEPVAMPAPKPEPKPLVAAPKPVAPKPKPEPVVAAKPVKPKPVVVAEPEPVPEEKKPVVAEVKPEPVPDPVAEEPKPVVAKPEPPVVEPEPEPAPVLAQEISQPEPEPMVEAPKPVVPEPVVAEAKPEPIPTPEVFLAPEPEDKPEPVVEPAPAIVPEPEVVAVESNDEPAQEASKLQALLASLDSHGDEPEPAPETIVDQDVAELEALVAQLGNEPVERPEPEPVQVVEPEAAPEDEPEAVAPAVAVSLPPLGGGQRYAATPASNEKLAELLRKDQPKTTASLDDLLDGLMENIND